MSGGTQSQQTTTTQQLTPEQQQLVGLAQPGYQNFAASGTPTLPTGSQAVSPFTSAQIAGQNAVLGSTGVGGGADPSGIAGGLPQGGAFGSPGTGGTGAGGVGGGPTMANTVGTAAGTNQYLSSGAFLDPGSNPYVQNAVKAATDPIFQDLSQRTLPQQQATAASGSGANFGSSREGIQEGLDVQGAQRAAGQAGANIMNTALGQGLSATNQAISQAPTTAGSLALPGATTEAVGSEQQTQAQNVLNANNAAQLQQWLLPLIQAQALTQGAAGTPGGSTTAVGSGTSDPGLAANLMGGAAAAGGLLGGLGKLGGTAGLSGLMGALGRGGAAAGGGASSLASLLPLLAV
jgi:hypothetical protein